jgi:hypothetical protein
MFLLAGLIDAAFIIGTGIALAAASTATLWPWNAVSRAELVVSRMHPLPDTALTLVEKRLSDIPRRYADTLTLV